jgi:hypothetical protein
MAAAAARLTLRKIGLLSGTKNENNDAIGCNKREAAAKGVKHLRVRMSPTEKMADSDVSLECGISLKCLI